DLQLQSPPGRDRTPDDVVWPGGHDRRRPHEIRPAGAGAAVRAGGGPLRRGRFGPGGGAPGDAGRGRGGDPRRPRRRRGEQRGERGAGTVRRRRPRSWGGSGGMSILTATSTTREQVENLVRSILRERLGDGIGPSANGKATGVGYRPNVVVNI